MDNFVHLLALSHSRRHGNCCMSHGETYAFKWPVEIASCITLVAVPMQVLHHVSTHRQSSALYNTSHRCSCCCWCCCCCCCSQCIVRGQNVFFTASYENALQMPDKECVSWIHVTNTKRPLSDVRILELFVSFHSSGLRDERTRVAYERGRRENIFSVWLPVSVEQVRWRIISGY